MSESVARPNLLLTTLPVLVLGLLSACGGGGGGGGGGSSGASHVDVLLTDAPADELLSFSATVTDVRLVDSGGATTANLLSGSTSVEMLGLTQGFAWLASRDLPAGTYTAVRMSFAPGSYAARRNDGSAVAVDSVSDQLTASLAVPFQIGSSGYRRILVDLDLSSSLQGSVASPPLLFTPLGSSSDDHGGSSMGIDEIKGVVQSSNAGAGTLVLDAFLDDDQSVPLGPVVVTVLGTTLLLQDDGAPFASATDFFAALVAGSTLLEVHGGLVNGQIQATRIEVEDNSGGGGSQNLVKIDGLVLGIGPGTTLEIAIAEVEDGASIVAAAFGGTIPGTLTVTWDGSTVFLLEEHVITDSASLAIGQEVKVKFPVFANAPFLASRIEIESEGVEFEGHITSTSGLPSSFVVHLSSDDPAILSGQVASTSTDVTVDISGSTLFLDAGNDPSLTTSQLLVGLKVQPEGSISGPPTGPTITATKTKVFPGRLRDAVVTTVNAGNGTFTTSGGDVQDPFGGGVAPGSLSVTIASGAVFSGDAATQAGFFNLFAGLGAGETLVVEIEGIGTGAADALVAHEVRARVEN